jgi:hypothetical protein
MFGPSTMRHAKRLISFEPKRRRACDCCTQGCGLAAPDGEQICSTIFITLTELASYERCARPHLMGWC